MLEREESQAQVESAQDGPIEIRAETSRGSGLQEQEERLTAALVASGAGTYHWDLDTFEIKVDAALALLLGLPAMPYLLSLEEFCAVIHPDDRDLFQKTFRQHLRTTGEFESEYRLLLADGSVRWLIDKGRVARGRDGQLHQMTGTCVDITSRKRMEEELRANQAWLRNALSVGQMGTWQILLDSRMVVASESAEQLWGFETQKIRPLEDYLRLIHPDDLLLVSEILVNPPPQFRLEFRVRPRGRDETVWLAIQGERELDAQGRSVSLIGAVSDVSPLKHTEQVLQNQTLELEARVRELNCLYAVSRLVQTQGSLDQLLERVVEIIPSGFSRPDNIRVRLVCDGKIFQPPGFSPGVASLVQELRLPEGSAGHLEIHRMSSETREGEPGFSYGEQTLVQALAKPLSRAVERAQVLRALSESEDRWRTMMAALAEGVVLFDDEGRVQAWNQSAERLLGGELIKGQSIGCYQGFVVREDGTAFPTEEYPAQVTLQTGRACDDVVLGLARPGGEISWLSINSRPLFRRGDEELSGVVVSFADITERKRLEQQLQYDAFHDRLTGVANRSLFMDRLGHVVARAERFGERFAVFVMDMDNFKLINDSFGHLVGDKLLCAFVDRIQELLRPVDTLSRFGGDEFTLLLEETEDQAAVEQIATRILEALQQPFMLDGNEITVSSSIGIMLGDGACRSADQALLDADVALYEAKRQGKNQYVVFDARMRGEKVSRLYLESELRRALQEVELAVQFQPIVNLQTRQAVGCEALIRWKHPVMGNVDSSRLIQVAEETGLITPLGRFVLDQTCASLAEWLEVQSIPADFYVSVNVSPKEFYSKDLVPYVQATLTKYGLQGSNLRLEVTENVIIRHDREAAAILTRLQAMGIQTCLDDFGTGYSSLSYLHQLSFNVIKVDRSFIQSLTEKRQSREVVRSILGLAEALGMQAVAEGVETEEQLAYAQALGFSWIQGYVLHQPLERSDMLKLFGSTV